MSASDFHPTAVKAVNKALVQLGHDVTVELLDEDSEVPEEKKAAYVYDESRRQVLRDHAWGFARREAQTTSWLAPTHRGDRYPHHAELPPDVLQVVAAKDIDGADAEYTIVDREIHSTRPLSLVVYTEDVQDLDRWSAGAYKALVLRLAADLSKIVTGRLNERELQEQAYAAEIRAAKLQDSRSVNVSETAWGDNYYAERMMGRRHGRGRRPCGI